MRLMVRLIAHAEGQQNKQKTQALAEAEVGRTGPGPVRATSQQHDASNHRPIRQANCAQQEKREGEASAEQVLHR